ncbi:MAG: ATP-binding protein [Bryobacteraceae bacterium]|nr:ATP-binding protein [Bryobacteraceae bacterium]
MNEFAISIPVHSEADVLEAMSRATAVSAAAACSPPDQARILLAAFHLAREARNIGAEFVLNIVSPPALVMEAASHRVQFPLPQLPQAANASFDPATLLSDLTEHQTAQEQILRKALEEVHAVQTEIDETNRGVLALYVELDDRAEKLRQADQLKSRFLSYASHELRTPLNGIVGLVRLLNSRTATRDPGERKQLSFVLSSAEEMLALVNDLLDLAKLEAGKITIHPSEFGLEFVFGALRGIFRPLLQSGDVVLYFDDTSAAPSIYSDEAKISQILRNLISNAIKFTEHGEVHVWAQLEGKMVRISVRDTGIGIAPEHLTKIFEEYAQIEHTLQRRVRGTGLGLPLCRRMSALLGGFVEVESELGKGSTFTLVLPLKFGTYPALPDALPAAAQRVAPALARPRVLIIDHAEIDRYLTGQLIRTDGPWEIIHAADGQVGLEMARTQRPDLIVLDLAVPRVDATAVLADLHANPATASIPVVAVTARRISAEDRPAIEAATVAILSKDQLNKARRFSVRFGPPVSIELFDN